MTKSRFLAALLGLGLALLMSVSGAGAADKDSVGAPWQKRCSTYHTPRQFVVDSTLFCMKHATTKDCRQKAARYFEGCRFSGDYKKMSQRVHAKMLVVLALAGSATVRKGESM